MEGNSVGGYKSLYLSNEEKKFADTYLNNFNEWIKQELHLKMDNTVEFCQKHIEYHAKQLERWKQLKKIADVDKKKQDVAYNTLTTNYFHRPEHFRKGYLEGKEAQGLLKQAKLTVNQFLKKVEVGKENAR